MKNVSTKNEPGDGVRQPSSPQSRGLCLDSSLFSELLYTIEREGKENQPTSTLVPLKSVKERNNRVEVRQKRKKKKKN